MNLRFLDVLTELGYKALDSAIMDQDSRNILRQSIFEAEIFQSLHSKEDYAFPLVYFFSGLDLIDLNKNKIFIMSISKN